MNSSATLRPPAGSSAHPLNRMRQQAEELEGVFLSTLMKEMFSNIDSKGTFGGGFAEETWRGMQAEQYAAVMAEAGGIGLADTLMADLIAVQEHAPAQTSKPINGAYR
jgi:peptidoglycan hydrolase FlgJ